MERFGCSFPLTATPPTRLSFVLPPVCLLQREVTELISPSEVNQEFHTLRTLFYIFPSPYPKRSPMTFLSYLCFVPNPASLFIPVGLRPSPAFYLDLLFSKSSVPILLFPLDISGQSTLKRRLYPSPSDFWEFTEHWTFLATTNLRSFPFLLFQYFDLASSLISFLILISFSGGIAVTI